MSPFTKVLAALQQAIGRRRTGTRKFQRMYKKAQRALAAGRPYIAMQILGPFLGYPPDPEHENPAVWHDALDLFAQIVEALGIDVNVDVTLTDKEMSDDEMSDDEMTDDSANYENGLAFLLRQSAANPNDVALLNLLASLMPAINAGGIGTMMLERASLLAPDNGDILASLALHLLDQRYYQRAVQKLTESPRLREQSRKARYALTWAYLHQGKLNDARRQWSLCEPPDGPQEQHTYETVEGILQRIDAYNRVAHLHVQDLRGWNFAFNGSFLLHCSPVGFEQMHGRYGVVYDSEAQLLEGIQRLAAVLEACKLSVERVYSLPDHDSQVLATAAAQYLACELTPWPIDGIDAPGLIVIHDPEQLRPDVLRSFYEHRPGQIVWAHAVSWMDDMPLGPDFITYLHERVLSPWAERPADLLSIPKRRTGTIEQLASSILNAEVTPDALADLPDLCAWIAALPELPPLHAPGALRSSGTRRHFFADSPVSSHSFRFYDHPEAGVASLAAQQRRDNL